MKGRKQEAECIVRIDQQDSLAHVCVASWPSMYRKMCRLYGQPVNGDGTGQMARFRIPLKAISFRRLTDPAKPRRMHAGGFKRREKRQSGDLYAENVSNH